MARSAGGFAALDAHAHLSPLTQAAVSSALPAVAVSEPTLYPLVPTQGAELRAAPALDYLVWEREHEEPLAVPLTAALGREALRIQLTPKLEERFVPYAASLFPRYQVGATPPDRFFWQANEQLLGAILATCPFEPSILASSRFDYAAVLQDPPHSVRLCLGRADGRVVFPPQRPEPGEHPIIVSQNAGAFAAVSCKDAALSNPAFAAGAVASSTYSLTLSQPSAAATQLQVRSSAGTALEVSAPFSYVVSNNARYLGVATDSEVQIWELASGKVRVWKAPTHGPLQLYAVSDDGARVAGAKDEGSLCIVSPQQTPDHVEVSCAHPPPYGFRATTMHCSLRML
jgi:hypothetical protein